MVLEQFWSQSAGITASSIGLVLFLLLLVKHIDIKNKECAPFVRFIPFAKN